MDFKTTEISNHFNYLFWKISSDIQSINTYWISKIPVLLRIRFLIIVYYSKWKRYKHPILNSCTGIVYRAQSIWKWARFAIIVKGGKGWKGGKGGKGGKWLKAESIKLPINGNCDQCIDWSAYDYSFKLK